MRVRRTAYVVLEGADEARLDVAALLRGEVHIESRPVLRARTALTGEAVSLTPDEVRLLASVPGEWRQAEEVGDVDALLELARKGVVVADAREPRVEDLRRRDETLSQSYWHPDGALHYAFTRWRGIDVFAPRAREPAVADEVAIQDAIKRAGAPPPHFHERTDAQSVHELPPARRDDGLFATLARRCTTRAFDSQRALPVEQLALVLDTVFGARGMLSLRDDVVLLRKTSPSGGALHPIEAYPLVVNVAGIRGGLYHYAPRLHALELLEPLDVAAARRLARTFVAGQAYFADAHVLVVLAARFPRRFWKYRNEKAYSILLLEAGHLSQTNYLVCTELGLGAFVTAAINSVDIDERLGLDAAAEGAVAVCGIGIPADAPSPLDAPFVPYEPLRRDAL